MGYKSDPRKREIKRNVRGMDAIDVYWQGRKDDELDSERRFADAKYISNLTPYGDMLVRRYRIVGFPQRRLP